MKCTYYQIQKRKKYQKHECLKKEERVSKKCYYQYCSSQAYETCPIYNEEKHKNCFFSTILHEEMEFSLGCPMLENLTNFRKNILEIDNKYYELLTIHDRISPVIAETIRNSNNDHLSEFLSIIYSNFLVPMNKAIINGEIEKTLKYYNKMLKLLIVNFSLEQEYYRIIYYYKYPENYSKRPKKRILSR